MRLLEGSTLRQQPECECEVDEVDKIDKVYKEDMVDEQDGVGDSDREGRCERVDGAVESPKSPLFIPHRNKAEIVFLVKHNFMYIMIIH